METKQLNATCQLTVISDAKELRALITKHKSSAKIDLASIVILPINQVFNMIIKGYQMLETAKAKALQVVGDCTSSTGEVFKNVSATVDASEVPQMGSTCTIQTSGYMNAEGKERVKAIVTKSSNNYDFSVPAENVAQKSETVVAP